MQCNLKDLVGSKLVDIIAELYKIPNLKFIIYDNCTVCNCCGRILYKSATDKLYIPGVDKDKYKDYKLENFYTSGNFYIVELIPSNTPVKSCDECCDREESETKERPFGGAFRDMDDYYTWKNGTGFIDIKY